MWWMQKYKNTEPKQAIMLDETQVILKSSYLLQTYIYHRLFLNVYVDGFIWPSVY